MAKNEDGEFELILGNRQLLSVFFIVVVLLGVFFTMGYIVGRNSSPIGTTDVTTAHKETPKPVVIDPPAPRETPKPTPPPPAPAPAPTETAAQLPPHEEPKPVETPKPQPPKPEPVKEKAIKAAPPKPEPVKQAPVKQVKQAPAPAGGGQPVSGETYLQLVATAKAEADVMVDVLRKKGFGAIAVRHPDRPEIFRVLVGPIPDTAVNKTKSDLQGAGFPGDKALRKTF
jgi:outer membrane biosynthesis protein TonB